MNSVGNTLMDAVTGKGWLYLSIKGMVGCENTSDELSVEPFCVNQKSILCV